LATNALVCEFADHNRRTATYTVNVYIAARTRNC
jgi:hypothetical protein